MPPAHLPQEIFHDLSSVVNCRPVEQRYVFGIPGVCLYQHLRRQGEDATSTQSTRTLDMLTVGFMFVRSRLEGVILTWSKMEREQVCACPPQGFPTEEGRLVDTSICFYD